MEISNFFLFFLELERIGKYEMRLELASCNLIIKIRKPDLLLIGDIGVGVALVDGGGTFNLGSFCERFVFNSYNSFD